MTRFRDLGEFAPIDRINGIPETPNISTKRRGQAGPMPISTPKRRRVERSPQATSRSAHTIEDARPRGDDEAHSINDKWMFSPSPKGRPMSSSQSTISNRNSNTTVPELRLANASAHRTQGRRRRRRNRGLSDDISAVTSFPHETVVEDTDMEDDEEDVESTVEVVSSRRAAPSTQNTNLTIEIRDISHKIRFRDRMQDRLPARASHSKPVQPRADPRLNGTKKTVCNSSWHGSESADELSQEYFPDLPPRKTSKSPRQTMDSPEDRRPRLPAASAAKIHMSSFAQSIIDGPLRVAAAFCYPSHSLGSSEESGEGGCDMTIEPQLPCVLRPIDVSCAQRGKPFWLRVDLKRTNAIRFSKNSPVVLFEIPKQEHLKSGWLGPLMGLKFQDPKDAKRMVAWAGDADYSKCVRISEVPLEKINRTFDSSFSKAKNTGRTPFNADSATPHPRRTSGGSVTESRPDETSTTLNSGPEHPASSDAVVSSPPARKGTREPMGRMTRQRSSRGAPEPVDLESPALDANIYSCLETRRSVRSRNTRPAAATSGLGLEVVERWTEENPAWAKDWRIPLTYLRTTVDKDDVARLDEGEFLNDNVINFYLQFLQDTLKKGGSSIAKRVYFHNTFFYEKLRPKRGRAISFDGVRRWTAKIDLFSYDYIVVPVNEHSHWWVAIMSNVPKFVAESMPQEESGSVAAEGTQDEGAKSDPPTSVTVEGDRPTEPRGDGIERATASVKDSVSSPIVAGTDSAMNTEDAMTGKFRKQKTMPTDVCSVSKDKPAQTGVSEPIQLRGDGDRNKDGNDDDDDDDVEVTEIKSDIIAAPPPAAALRKLGKGRAQKVYMKNTKSQNPKDPRILTLDSLGSPHSVSIDHMKQWLLAEIEERKGVKPTYPGGLGMTVKTIPQQENFCDCGVYLLLYVQEFIKDPDGFIEDMVLRNERKWDTSAPDMRKQLRDLILHMQKEFQATEEKGKMQKKSAIAAPTKAAAANQVAISSSTRKPGRSSSPCMPKSPLADVSAAAAAAAALVDHKGTDWIQQQPTSRGEGLENGRTEGIGSHSGSVDEEGSSALSSIGPAEAGVTSPFKEGSPNVFT